MTTAQDTQVEDEEAEDDSEREDAILELAGEYMKDGEIEADEGTVRLSDLKPCPGDSDLRLIPTVSEGDDNGAYVRVWLWVDFGGTDLDKQCSECDELDCDTHNADEDEEVA